MGLDSPCLWILTRTGGGCLTDKSSVFLINILQRGSNCFYEGGGWGSIPVFLWVPRVLVIPQVLDNFLYILSHQVILDGGPIASREGGSQMRRNITRVLSDRLYLRTNQ